MIAVKSLSSKAGNHLCVFLLSARGSKTTRREPSHVRQPQYPATVNFTADGLRVELLF